MIGKLVEHIRNHIDLDLGDPKGLGSYFEYRSYRKKEDLLQAGKRNDLHFFVVKGCLRMYFVSAKGVEHTTEFALENWWITDYSSFGQGRASAFGIQAVEESRVLAIGPKGQEALLRRFPGLERYFRLIHQRAHAAAQYRTRYLFDYSREEMYHHFVEHFPDFAQRVPQHLLASYLDMTPEYLSGIKGKGQS